MESTIERVTHVALEEQLPVDGRFQVWIDVNCGITAPPDWWWNSAPTTLQLALVESVECRKAGFPSKVMPAGANPRPDGRWDNPV